MTKTPLGCLAALLSLGAAQAAPATPPPGQYRIDAESSVRSGSGPATSERIERVDGATGNRTVITHAGPPGTPAGQQTYPGSGPVTWCVPAVSTPPANLAGRCDARWWPQSGGASLQADCQAGRMQEQWKQVDARTWERQMTFKATAGAAGNDPSAAIAMAQRGLSPADAAKVRAELPAPNATADAMAPVYAQIEETIRTGKPEEAAAARQQLSALKAAQGGRGPAAATTRLTERWTRVADTCTAGS
jgi:hypothetical protein